MFGHEAGAFTGAREGKAGLFEAAGRGTVFLDEVGEMPRALQPKLLRVLEAREFRRVGSVSTRQLEARVVAATNVEPAQQPEALRSDLLFRLAGFTLRLPPLRDRSADIPQLALYFLRGFERRHGMDERRFTRAALELLQAHNWPGNVRELRGVVEHTAIVSSETSIDVQDLRSAMQAHEPQARGRLTPVDVDHEATQQLETVRRRFILKALEENRGNVSRTARQLGIPRSTLRSMLARFDSDQD